ncbi:MAG: ACP S-malonyltransferase [Acidimicrobiia bacterium]|nr:ACP S-malonyltransferase [Acidimicrobiia bacterium]
MNYAVLFPGQGAQYVGMGADLFESASELLVERADEILGWSLKDMCLVGSEEALTRTEHAQPALYALAYALWQDFSAAMGNRQPSAAGGHSLGEYTALTAAGALSFENGLRLVAERGLAMAAAADLEPSAMAALLGADPDLAEGIAANRRSAGGRLWVANLNAPGQVVVAGGEADIDWVVEQSREFGVRRAVKLNVAGAFHTPFMAPAAEQLSDSIADVEFSEPRFDVYGNVTAAPLGANLGQGLVDQLTSPVRFAESLANMSDVGVEVFVHVGPGDVTAGMARRSAPDREVLVVNDQESLEAAVQRLAI